jgi:hypothetical protein
MTGIEFKYKKTIRYREVSGDSMFTGIMFEFVALTYIANLVYEGLMSPGKSDDMVFLDNNSSFFHELRKFF